MQYVILIYTIRYNIMERYKECLTRIIMYLTDGRKFIICTIVWIMSLTRDMLNCFGTLVENILYEYIYLQPALKDVTNVT